MTYDLVPIASEALYTGVVTLPTAWYDTHNFSNGPQSTDVFNTLLMAVFEFVQDLHFKVSKMEIGTLELFVHFAEKGPDLGSDTRPYAVWLNHNNKHLLAPTSHYFTQDWQRADERAASGKSKKKAKSKSSAPAPHVYPFGSQSAPSNGKTRPAGPKSSRMSPGMVLKQFGLKLCSTAVFEKCNTCPGAGGVCLFS